MTSRQGRDDIALLDVAKDITRLTWAQLAHVIAVSPETIRKWRHGRDRIGSGPARPLLEIIAAGPDSWPAKIHVRIAEALVVYPAKRRSKKPPPLRLATPIEHRLGICGADPEVGIMACPYCIAPKGEAA